MAWIEKWNFASIQSFFHSLFFSFCHKDDADTKHEANFLGKFAIFTFPPPM